MKRTGLVLCLVFSAAATLHGQNPQMRAQRERLQTQVVQRFITNASTELALDQATRAKLEQHLRDRGEQRRELAQRSGQLRRRMMASVLDSTTSAADFRGLLAELTSLRQKEDELWKSEQEALARFLTPRQQVQFVFMWLRFNDQIRETTMRPADRLPRGRPRP